MRLLWLWLPRVVKKKARGRLRGQETWGRGGEDCDWGEARGSP